MIAWLIRKLFPITAACAWCGVVKLKEDMVRADFCWFCNENHARKYHERTW